MDVDWRGGPTGRYLPDGEGENNFAGRRTGEGCRRSGGCGRSLLNIVSPELLPRTPLCPRNSLHVSIPSTRLVRAVDGTIFSQGEGMLPRPARQAVGDCWSA